MIMRFWVAIFTSLWLAGATSTARAEDAATTEAREIVSPKPVSAFTSMGINQVIPTISLFTPDLMVLHGDAGNVNYSNAGVGFPILSIVFHHPVTRVGQYEISTFFRVGYGYKSGPFTVEWNDGTAATTERVVLHNLPLALAGRLQYEIPKLSVLRPGVLVGLTADWLHQRSELSALNGMFLIPGAMAGLSLTFLDPGTTTEKDWFGGFSFDLTYHHHIGSQSSRGLSFNLGMNIFI